MRPICVHLTSEMVSTCEAALKTSEHNVAESGSMEISDLEYLVRRSGFCPTSQQLHKLLEDKGQFTNLTTLDFWEACDSLAAEGRWHGDCAQGELDEAVCMLLEDLDGAEVTKGALKELLCARSKSNRELLSEEEFEVFWTFVDQDQKGVVSSSTIANSVRPKFRPAADNYSAVSTRPAHINIAAVRRDSPTADDERLSPNSGGTSEPYHALKSPNYERHRPPPIMIPVSPALQAASQETKPLKDTNSKGGQQPAPQTKKEAAKDGGCCAVM